MITNRGYLIISSIFVFLTISALANELQFLTISILLFSVILVEFGIYLVSLYDFNNIDVSTTTSKSRIFLGDETLIKTTFTHDGKRGIRQLLMTDHIPAGLAVLDKKSDLVINLEPGTEYSIKYTMKSLQMGKWNVGKFTLLTTDKFGIFMHKRSIENQCNVGVLPIIKMGRTKVQARIQSGAFPTRAKRDPRGTDFTGIREYYAGDDYRAIAWKQMAKTPQHNPLIKQYEFDQEIGLILVIGNSKFTNDGQVGNRKLDIAINAALSLGSIVNSSGGRFNVIFSQNNNPTIVSGSVYDLCDKLYQITPDKKFNLENLINFSVSFAKQSSLVLFLLDSPYPNLIESKIFTRRYSDLRNIRTFFFDTSTFHDKKLKTNQNNDPYQLIVNRETEHLKQQVKMLRSYKISADICTKSNTSNKLVNSISTNKILLEGFS
jgi:uncharacterized protein (DUF58 family)